MELRARPPNVVAHRGASSLAPENTLSSVRKALEIGAKMIEVDVHTTLDGEIVVMHDADVSRTTNGSGVISEMSYSRIAQLDAGSWFGPEFRGEGVPALDEVLSTVRGRSVLCIEIKRAYPKEVLEKVLKHGLLDDVVIFDFDHQRLRELRSEEADVCTLALGVDSASLTNIEREGFDALGASFSKANEELVERAHEIGMAVFVYTVDDVDRMRRLIEIGVDGIISNKPQDCIPLVEGLK